MRQHATLTPERWGRFSLDQQILMIANEMNRASKLMEAPDRERLRKALARVLELVDLTIEVATRHALRRELLRWRDLVARLYVEEAPEAGDLLAAFRVLLTLTPVAARQRAHLSAFRS